METPPVDPELLDFAVGLAQRAGALAAERFFWQDNRTRNKPDGTEVTDADLAVEELIRTELARYVPDDAVHGEEGGATPGRSGRRWITDPIDGTYYFTRRIPLFDTTLAFEDEHGPAIGVIHQPVSRQTVYAGRGLGCWTSAEQARVSDRTRLTGARTWMGNPGTWSAELLLALHNTVFLSTAGSVPGLVTGQIDAFVIAGAPMGYEDVAPLPVIIGEAGGRVTDLAGRPVLTGDRTVLASNGHLHDELLALVAGIEPGRDWHQMVRSNASVSGSDGV